MTIECKDLVKDGCDIVQLIVVLWYTLFVLNFKVEVKSAIKILLSIHM